jgi:hypothetical protein
MSNSFNRDSQRALYEPLPSTSLGPLARPFLWELLCELLCSALQIAMPFTVPFKPILHH